MARTYLATPLDRFVQRSPAAQKTIWAIEYAGLAAFWGLCSILPVRWASAIGYRVIWTIAPRLSKFRHSVNNLSVAFPDKSAAEIAALARDTWGSMGRVLAEYPHVEALSSRADDKGTELIIDSEVQALLDAGKPIMFVTAHIGNWELCAGVIARRLAAPLSVIYSAQQNPFIGNAMLRMRKRLGCGLIEKAGAMRGVMKELSRGSNVGMLIDTRADEGEALPFFGVDAMTSLMPARMALRMKVPVVPLRVERCEGATFRVRFFKPIDVDRAQGDDRAVALQITREILSHYEAWIKDKPGDWLCAKRRWPKQAKRAEPQTKVA